MITPVVQIFRAAFPPHNNSQADNLRLFGGNTLQYHLKLYYFFYFKVPAALKELNHNKEIEDGMRDDPEEQ